MNKWKNISEKCNKFWDGKYKHHEKSLRVGLYIYVDHTINSARGHQPYILVVLGSVLNLWCDLHIYK